MSCIITEAVLQGFRFPFIYVISQKQEFQIPSKHLGKKTKTLSFIEKLSRLMQSC